jgi:hypothetical protein
MRNAAATPGLREKFIQLANRFVSDHWKELRDVGLRGGQAVLHGRGIFCTLVCVWL